MPDRFESGTPNLPGIYGLHAALGELEQEGIAGAQRGGSMRFWSVFLRVLIRFPAFAPSARAI